MKLLILTQKVDRDDDVLGFFHDWIVEFAKHYEKVSVVCLWKGKYDLPQNVSVYSLGKELGLSKLAYIRNFYSYIFSLRGEYDSVFVHMNQIYVILGGMFWKLWNKRIGLWYVHRQTSLSLWIAEKMVNTIFTSSKESFRISTKKVSYLGHGIDSRKFTCDGEKKNDSGLKIVHVGRITPIKKLETLVRAGEILKNTYPDISIEFVGTTKNDSDTTYLESLKKYVREHALQDAIIFRGGVSSADIPEIYCQATISVNMAPTGGWDKSVLESIMSSCPVFVSNLGFMPVFGPYKDLFMYTQDDPTDLARKIELFLSMSGKEKIVAQLQTSALERYDLRILIKTITDKL